MEAPPPAPAPAPTRPRLLRGVLAVTAVINLLFGIALVSTTWTKAFGGTGGEDTLLFQIVSSVLLAVIALGGFAVVLAVRPRPGLAAVLAAGMIVVGVLLILFTLFVLGIPEIALGVAVFLARPRPKDRAAKGPRRWVFVATAAFNLFFGVIGFVTVGLPAFTGTGTAAFGQLLGAWSVAALALGGIAVLLAVRPSRQPALVLGIVQMGLGAFLPVILFPTFPFAILEILLGALAVRTSRKL